MDKPPIRAWVIEAGDLPSLRTDDVTTEAAFIKFDSVEDFKAVITRGEPVLLQWIWAKV